MKTLFILKSKRTSELPSFILIVYRVNSNFTMDERINYIKLEITNRQKAMEKKLTDLS